MKTSKVEREQLLALNKKIGQNIRKLRKERGFSQEILAYEAGVERSQMGKIERGAGVSIGTLFKLSKTLKVEIRDFFDNI